MSLIIQRLIYMRPAPPTTHTPPDLLSVRLAKMPACISVSGQCNATANIAYGLHTCASSIVGLVVAALVFCVRLMLPARLAACLGN